MNEEMSWAVEHALWSLSESQHLQDPESISEREKGGMCYAEPHAL